MFDNDTAGVKAMERYHELYGLPSLLLPMEKDLSDSVKKHGQKAVKKVLTPLINAYEQGTEKSNGKI
jgi:DNA primase